MTTSTVTSAYTTTAAPAVRAERVVLVALAAAVGAAYTLSPLTVWFLVWMAGLFWWTISTTTGAERKWMVAVLAAALVVRLPAIGVLPFLADPSTQDFRTYFGDAQYAIQRSIWIRNVALGVPIAPRDYLEAFEPIFGWTGYHYVLAYLHALFGPSPYGVALVSTGLFLTASLMLHRLVRRGFGSIAAFGCLAVVVFMPSWILWSVAPLKEPMQFFLLASALTAATALAGPRWDSRLVAACCLAAVVAVSGTLRNGGAELVMIGAGIGGALWLATRRWWLLVTMGTVVVIVGVLLARNTTVQLVAAREVKAAAARHLGHTRMPAFSYRLLDERFYAMEPAQFTLTFDEGKRFLTRAAIGFFVEPVPWRLQSAVWLAVVPQQALWYLLLVLASIGALVGMARQPGLTCLLLGFVAAGAIVIAPNSGNMGTLIRHRDMIVPFVSALAGLGAVVTLKRVVS